MPAIGSASNLIIKETLVVGKQVLPKIAKVVESKTFQNVVKGAVDEAKFTKLAAGVAKTESPSILGKMMQVPARMIDFATGHTRVNINTVHTVKGVSPSKWADEFLKNPSSISPIASGIRHEGGVIIGKPFPGGPDIGILLKNRTNIKTAAGLEKTVLDVEYSGAFVGPGRITIAQKAKGTLHVTDEWLNVENKSFLPSLGAENGHPIVAGLGFKGIGDKALGQAPNAVADAAGMLFNASLKVMTFPFSIFK